MNDQTSSEARSEKVAKDTYARYVLDTRGYAAYNLICRGDAAEEERPDTTDEVKP